jgi:signal transduction histidine kinase
VVFGAFVLALGSIALWSTRSVIEEQLTRRIETEMALLDQEFRSNGLDRLVAVIQQRTRSEPNLDYDYFLADPAGNRLAGNLPVTNQLGWNEISAREDASEDQSGKLERVRVLVRQLGDGLRVGVGEDLEQVDELEETFLRVLASALGIVLVLGIGGGLLLSAGFLRRLDAITRTADAIIAGDLSRRIERTGSGDFDHLAGTLNTMLDRIAGLIENVRQVSSDIAHDLRTPLSRLRQDLEEAKEKDLTATDYRKVVERAVGDADLLLDTFSALLRIAQIEAGTRRSAFRVVDLSEVMRTLADAYAPPAEESGRPLRTEIADAIRITGDRELLSLLFANLVENALHHTAPGTTISLRLAREEIGVIAEVADTGAGIPEEERTKVFQRFYRLERSRTTPGSGLGLSTVAAIVVLHQASIELLDNKPGLRVAVRFPSG